MFEEVRLRRGQATGREAVRSEPWATQPCKGGRNSLPPTASRLAEPVKNTRRPSRAVHHSRWHRKTPEGGNETGGQMPRQLRPLAGGGEQIPPRWEELRVVDSRGRHFQTGRYAAWTGCESSIEPRASHDSTSCGDPCEERARQPARSPLVFERGHTVGGHRRVAGSGDVTSRGEGGCGPTHGPLPLVGRIVVVGHGWGSR